MEQTASKEIQKTVEFQQLTDKTEEKKIEGVTFKINDTVPLESPKKIADDTLKNLVSSHQIMTDYEGRVLICATNKPNTFKPSMENGFVAAAVNAYNNHYNLILRPDDVWIAIISQFANYVEKNAEKLRHHFVDHEGSKDLQVFGGGNMYTAEWKGIVNEFAEKIDQNTKSDVKEWVTASFSTTTSYDKMISQVLLMGAMQHYFKYKVYFMCGIPSVTLLGTLEDWKNIRQRVEKFSEYELSDWAKSLSYILDKFIETYEGKGDKDFWNKICNYRYDSVGSGGQREHYVDGWILAFAPFNKNGNYALPSFEEIQKADSYGWKNYDKVTSAAIQVPVEASDDSGEHKLIFFAGMLQNIWEEETKSIRPSVDLAIIDVTNSVENPKKRRY